MGFGLRLTGLAAAWALAFGGTFLWLAQTIVGSDARLNLVLLGLLAAGLVGRQLAGPARRLGTFARGADTRLPLALALLGCAGYLVTHTAVGFHSVDAVLCGVATYGALGLFLPRRAFLRGLPVALLVILILPMGGHMDTYLGFPLRIATAEVVQSALHAAGLASVTRETVVVVENAAAHVDLACSGIRSLWSGLLFFFAASWGLQPRIGPRWLVALAGFVAALLSLNVLRVLILSLVVLVAKAPLAARIIHAPLGVVAFFGACAFALACLRRLSLPALPPYLPISVDCMPDGRATTGVPSSRRVGERSKGGTERDGPASPGLAARRRDPVLLAAAFALVALANLAGQLLAPPRAQAALPHLAFAPPAEMAAAAVAFTPTEARFLGTNGADYSGKWRFTWRGAAGSFLVVAARSWRAHHPPEQCLAGAGLDLAGIGTRLVAAGFPVRVVDVAGEGSRASYWYQSLTHKTDDHAARVWDGLRGDREWLMISILLDRPADFAAPDVKALHLALGAAAESLLATLEPTNNPTAKGVSP